MALWSGTWYSASLENLGPDALTRSSSIKSLLLSTGYHKFKLAEDFALESCWSEPGKRYTFYQVLQQNTKIGVKIATGFPQEWRQPFRQQTKKNTWSVKAHKSLNTWEEEINRLIIMSTLVQKCVLIWKLRSKAFYLMLDTAGLNLCAISASALLASAGDGATGRQGLQGRKDRVISPLKVWGGHFTVSPISTATQRDSHTLAAVTCCWASQGRDTVSQTTWRFPYHDLSSSPPQLYSLSPALLITSSDLRSLPRICKGTFGWVCL